MVSVLPNFGVAPEAALAMPGTRPGMLRAAPPARARRRSSSRVSELFIFDLLGSIDDEDDVGAEGKGHAVAGRSRARAGLDVLDVDLDLAVRRLDDVLRGDTYVRALDDAAVDAVDAVCAEPDLLGPDAGGDPARAV